MPGSDGLPWLVTPYNTSEFEEIIANLKAHSHAVKGQLEVIGVDLRRLLPRARNVQGGFFNLDLKAAAWQISRQFNQMAGAQNSTAAAATKALEFYHGNFVGGGPGQHGRNFDAGR